MAKYIEIRDLKSFPNLKRGGLNVLKSAVQSFFGCKSTLIDTPFYYAKKKLGIDISENIRRGCYIVDDNTVFLLGRIIYDHKTISALGILLKKPELAHSTKIFNVFESSLTHKLSDSYLHNFRDACDTGRSCRTCLAYFVERGEVQKQLMTSTSRLAI